MPLIILTVIAIAFTLREMRDLLIPIVLAVLLAYALAPVVDWLGRILPRIVAILLVMGIVVGGVGLSALSLQDDVTSVIAEMPGAARRIRLVVREYQKARGEGALGNLRRTADELERTVRTATGDPPEAVPPPPQPSTPTSSAADYVMYGSLLIGQVTTVFFLTFFLLLSDDLYKRKLMSLAGPRLEKRRVTLQIIQSIGAQIERFLMALVFTSAVVAFATWLALAWMGVDHAAVWGLAAGVFNTIPFFGPVIVTIMLGTVAFAQFGVLGQAAAVAGISLLITTLEGYLLTPILMSRASQMNSIAVFVSILLWSWIWGIAGTLLAMPVMMVIKTVCDRVEGWQPVGELLGEYEGVRARPSILSRRSTPHSASS